MRSSGDCNRYVKQFISHWFQNLYALLFTSSSINSSQEHIQRRRYQKVCHFVPINCGMKLSINWFHPTLYYGCDNLSMLGLKLNHVSKWGPLCYSHSNASTAIPRAYWMRYSVQCFWWLTNYCLSCTLVWMTLHNVLPNEIMRNSEIIISYILSNRVPYCCCLMSLETIWIFPFVDS